MIPRMYNGVKTPTKFWSLTSVTPNSGNRLIQTRRSVRQRAAEVLVRRREYDSILADDKQILLNGTVDIELFEDGPVDVPLALQGGVITSALLDGEPARLKTMIPAPTGSVKQQQAKQQRPAIPVPSMLALLVEGKGRHQLKLVVRVAITRQGGWRMVYGNGPLCRGNVR